MQKAGVSVLVAKSRSSMSSGMDRVGLHPSLDELERAAHSCPDGSSAHSAGQTAKNQQLNTNVQFRAGAVTSEPSWQPSHPQAHPEIRFTGNSGVDIGTVFRMPRWMTGYTPSLVPFISI